MKQIFLLFSLCLMMACGANKTQEQSISSIVAPTEDIKPAGARVELLVNAQYVDCSGVGRMKCLQVKFLTGTTPSTSWENFYSKIQGFDYEPGYYYKLLVEKRHHPLKDVPADASSVSYHLVKVLEKKAQ